MTEKSLLIKILESCYQKSAASASPFVHGAGEMEHTSSRGAELRFK